MKFLSKVTIPLPHPSANPSSAVTTSPSLSLSTAMWQCVGGWKAKISHSTQKRLFSVTANSHSPHQHLGFCSPSMFHLITCWEVIRSGFCLIFLEGDFHTVVIVMETRFLSVLKHIILKKVNSFVLWDSLSWE